jgi:nucleoside-diphosphate-sugar epimerase
MLQLGRTISELAGAPPRFTFEPGMPGDPVRRRPDITRMQQRYGWYPSVPLASGLSETLAYFRALRLEGALAEVA